MVTPLGGKQCDLVAHHPVDGFYHVYFSGNRPGGLESESPEGGPDGAAVGDVEGAEEDEGAKGVGVLCESIWRGRLAEQREGKKRKEKRAESRLATVPGGRNVCGIIDFDDRVPC